MKRVFYHASVASLISIAVSLAICWAALKAVGSDLDFFAAAMCVVCPLVIAFPASAFTYSQKLKIAEAHKALEAAHNELAAMHQKLAERARLDDMTGLLNRSAFIASVEETRASESRGCLILIDADRFKQINDTFGHLAGDLALIEIAGAIRGASGQMHAIGRLGGEEFGVFAFSCSLIEARKLAEEIRAAVEKTHFAPDGTEPIPLTVSIGVVAARTGAGFSEIMGEADQRLYQAKRRGRNTVVAGSRAAA